MILAVDADGGIGKGGKLPWHIPSEFKYFRYYTKNTTCIMGRKTYEDIKSFKKTTTGPLLPDRSCIVITSDVRSLEKENTFDNVLFNDNPEQLIEQLDLAKNTVPNAFPHDFCIIGGKSIYQMFAKYKIVEEISITFLEKSYDCDTFIDVDELTDGYEVFCTHGGPDGWNVSIYRKSDEKW